VVFGWLKPRACTINGTHLPYGGELCNMGQSYHAMWLAVHPSFKHHSFHGPSATIAMQLQGWSAHHGSACTTIWCLGNLLCKELLCLDPYMANLLQILTRYTIVQERHGQDRQMVIIRVECSTFLAILILNHQHIKWPQGGLSVPPYPESTQHDTHTTSLLASDIMCRPTRKSVQISVYVAAMVPYYFLDVTKQTQSGGLAPTNIPLYW
jgi:hypothetical protein